MADVNVGNSNFSLKIGWHHVNRFSTVFQVALFQVRHCIYCILVTDIPVFIHAGVVDDG